MDSAVLVATVVIFASDPTHCQPCSRVPEVISITSQSVEVHRPKRCVPNAQRILWLCQWLAQTPRRGYDIGPGFQAFKVEQTSSSPSQRTETLSMVMARSNQSAVPRFTQFTQIH